MNLRTAKLIKLVLGNIVYIVFGVLILAWLVIGVIATKGILLWVIGAGAVIFLLVKGGIRLYDKACRTVQEIEEGDDPRNRHHLDYYGKDEYEDEYH